MAGQAGAEALRSGGWGAGHGPQRMSIYVQGHRYVAKGYAGPAPRHSFTSCLPPPIYHQVIMMKRSMATGYAGTLIQCFWDVKGDFEMQEQEPGKIEERDEGVARGGPRLLGGPLSLLAQMHKITA